MQGKSAGDQEGFPGLPIAPPSETWPTNRAHAAVQGAGSCLFHRPSHFSNVYCLYFPMQISYKNHDLCHFLAVSLSYLCSYPKAGDGTNSPCGPLAPTLRGSGSRLRHPPRARLSSPMPAWWLTQMPAPLTGPCSAQAPAACFCTSRSTCHKPLSCGKPSRGPHLLQGKAYTPAYDLLDLLSHDPPHSPLLPSPGLPPQGLCPCRSL